MVPNRRPHVSALRAALRLLLVAAALLAAAVGGMDNDYGGDEDPARPPSPSSDFDARLLDDEAPQFTVPMTLHVGLVGLDGATGSKRLLEPATLQESLTHSLADHTPYYAEAGFEEALDAVFRMSYEVTHLGGKAGDALHAAVGAAMRLSHSADVADRTPTYDVEISGPVEEAFDAAYAAKFVGDGYDRRFRPATTAQPYAALVLALDKDKLRKSLEGLTGGGTAAPPAGDFRYRYRYRGGGHTQAWLARRRYVVVDITAGPCQLGSSSAGEGTVSANSFPDLPPLAAATTEAGAGAAGPTEVDTVFVAKLAAVLVSAVERVFLPDVPFRYAPLDARPCRQGTRRQP